MSEAGHEAKYEFLEPVYGKLDSEDRRRVAQVRGLDVVEFEAKSESEQIKSLVRTDALLEPRLGQGLGTGNPL